MLLYTSIHLPVTRSPIQYCTTAVSDTPVTIIFQLVGQSSANSDGGGGFAIRVFLRSVCVWQPTGRSCTVLATCRLDLCVCDDIIINNTGRKGWYVIWEPRVRENRVRREGEFVERYNSWKIVSHGDVWSGTSWWWYSLAASIRTQKYMWGTLSGITQDV